MYIVTFEIYKQLLVINKTSKLIEVNNYLLLVIYFYKERQFKYSNAYLCLDCNFSKT